jgi:hypothetical protein
MLSAARWVFMRRFSRITANTTTSRFSANTTTSRFSASRSVAVDNAMQCTVNYFVNYTVQCFYVRSAH